MTSAGRLVSVGNVVVDLIADVPALPERGGDVVADSAGLAAGGAFNVLVAASRQGLPAAYGGAHGTGPFGELVRVALCEAGIDILLDPVPEADTGYDVALVEPSGERTFITVVGAEACLTEERIGVIDAGAGDMVHVSGYGLLREPNRSAVAEWLSGLPESVTVLVDPGPLGHTIEAGAATAVADRTDWFSCSAREAHLATGETDPVRAVAALAAFGRGTVVRLGADGCLVAEAGGTARHVPGFAVRVVDTNGAGDAHAGAFLAALARGLDPWSAARAANACAALAVTRRGPATAPTLAESAALLP